MHRFFVSPSDIQGNIIQLSEEDARHIRSLRLRPSECFIICNGEGFDYVCKLGDKSSGFGIRNSEFGVKDSASANLKVEILDKLPSRGEPTLKCSVFLAYSKGDRLDYAVQKCVELGAYEIVLFPSARCVSIPSDTQKKIARLQKIALETAKQCNRGRVPLLFTAKSFGDAISQAVQADLPLFFYELEESGSLKKILGQTILRHESPDNSQSKEIIDTISIVTGPEGGFEKHEAETAKSAGIKTASLGSRILRSETAPTAALAAIMFFYGEM